MIPILAETNLNSSGLGTTIGFSCESRGVRIIHQEYNVVHLDHDKNITPALSTEHVAH